MKLLEHAVDVNLFKFQLAFAGRREQLLYEGCASIHRLFDHLEPFLDFLCIARILQDQGGVPGDHV